MHSKIYFFFVLFYVLHGSEEQDVSTVQKTPLRTTKDSPTKSSAQTIEAQKNKTETLVEKPSEKNDEADKKKKIVSKDDKTKVEKASDTATGKGSDNVSDNSSIKAPEKGAEKDDATKKKETNGVESKTKSDKVAETLSTKTSEKSLKPISETQNADKKKITSDLDPESISGAKSGGADNKDSSRESENSKKAGANDLVKSETEPEKGNKASGDIAKVETESDKQNSKDAPNDPKKADSVAIRQENDRVPTGFKPSNQRIGGKSGSESGSNHFVAFIFFALIFAILAYVAFQKRKKILGYVIEGRRTTRSRRTSGTKDGKVQYKPLESEDTEAGATDFKYVY